MGGGTEIFENSFQERFKFQSTRPVGGGTACCMPHSPRSAHFNPPAPWGAGQSPVMEVGRKITISIHPPRGGRDNLLLVAVPLNSDFNPPAPWGAGQRHLFSHLIMPIFQSTRPVGGGTRRMTWTDRLVIISIHPPRGGRDHDAPPKASCLYHFNPPAPWGAGSKTQLVIDRLTTISIHPPRGGRDFGHWEMDCVIGISIHPPRGGRDIDV